MLDISYYATQHIGSNSEKFLKFFGKYEFKSVPALIVFLENIQEKVKWIVQEDVKKELVSLGNIFLNSLKIEQQNNSKAKFEYIMSQIVIDEAFPEFEFKTGVSVHGGICPKCGKKELYVPKHGNSTVIVCNRKDNCGYSSSIYKYLIEFKSMTPREAIKELAELGGVDLEVYERSLEKHIDMADEADKIHIEKKVVQPKPIIKKEVEIEYETFDAEKSYKSVDVIKLLPQYSKMTASQKFQMIATTLYRFSLKTNQNNKIKYYEGRKITDETHRWLSKKVEIINSQIGYLNRWDFQKLESHLMELFPLEDLVEFGFLTNSESKKPFAFKLGWQTQEGFCVIPNFDLYTDMVKGLKFRNTKLSENVDKKFKEPELSYGRISNPYPFGLTKEALMNTSTVFRLFEGSVDMLSMPYISGYCDIAIPGTNGLSEKQLGLFSNRAVVICFDNDNAGKDGTDKLIEKLKKVNAKVYLKKWDARYGSDVNEILKNGHIEKIL